MFNSKLKKFIVVFGCSFGFVFAQNTVTYEARLMNDDLTAPYGYESDIFIKHSGGIDTFEVYGLQVALLANDSINNGGILSVNYIPGTSQMNADQIPANLSIVSAVPGLQVIRFPAQFASGQGTIISKLGNGTRLGRFRLTTNVSAFANNFANIRWAFDSPSYGYSTLFYALIDNDPTDITDSTSHFNDLQNILLPIELSSFSASTKERDVILNWQTKTEINSSTFEVERKSFINSKQGEWIKVISIPAAGNSNSPKIYNYVDKKLNSGKHYFRLKMIDNDGTFEYSDMIETDVSLPKEFSLSQNYPNPFNPSTRVDYQLPYDSQVTIELYNITGERVAILINEALSAGYYQMEISASLLNLSSGIYIYRMTAVNVAVSERAFIGVKKLMLTK